MGRNAAHSVKLKTGERVGYSLFERPDQPCVLIRFRTRDGRYPERSTGVRTERLAHERAEEIIAREYEVPTSDPTTWDATAEQLTERLKACGLRQNTRKYYVGLLRSVQKFYSATTGPADITPHMVGTFRDSYANGQFVRSKKPTAKKKNRSSHTVFSRLRAYSALWQKWLVDELHVCGTNPWADVELPKRDKLSPKAATDDQLKHFVAWIDERFGPGWLLPKLFLAIKAYTGCRLADLCALKSAQVTGDRITFPADEAKGRKERAVPLGESQAKALAAIKGFRYVWQRHPQELRERLKAKGYPVHQLDPEFDPQRFYWWWEQLFTEYNKAHPDRPKLTSHMLRKRAFTAAWAHGVDVRKAAIALGCNPETALKHYVELDEQAVTDEVFDTLRNAPTPTLSPQKAPQNHPTDSRQSESQGKGDVS